MRGSHVRDGHPFFLGKFRFFDEPVHIVGVARHQDGGARLLKGSGGDHGVYCAPVAGEPGGTEQFTGATRDLGGDREDHNARKYKVDGSVTGATTQCLSQGERTDDDAGAAPERGHLQRSCLFVAGRDLPKSLAVEYQSTGFS
ncbi:hypothetical protein GCM10027570_54270 [Streptomonospora sediminis]